MKKRIILLGLPFLFAGLVSLFFASRRVEERNVARSSSGGSPSLETATFSRASRPAPPPAEAPALTPPTRTAAETKAVRVQRILRDYEQLTTAALAGLGTRSREEAGASHALARQLAFIERERRRDLATVLTPRELEDLELRESKAGQLVRRLLGESSVSDEQRRAVFRLQREFDLQFDQVFDATPRAYLDREYARQRLQGEIRAVLGEERFGAWLAGEGDLHARAAALAAQHGASPRLADDLRQTRDDYRLRMLALHATPELQPDQLRAATRRLREEIEARALTILGPTLYQTARTDLLNWLPQE